MFTYLDLNHAVLVLFQFLFDPFTALHGGGSPLLLQALQDVLAVGTTAVTQSLLQTGRQGKTLHSAQGKRGREEGDGLNWLG